MPMPPTDQNDDRSLGETLRAEREKQCLRVTDLASLANLPPDWICAIENDRFGDLPTTTTFRQLLSAYARGLNLYPGPWIETIMADIAPDAKTRRILRRNSYPIHDRRAGFRQSLAAMAAIAVLWMLYSMLIKTVFPDMRDVDTKSVQTENVVTEKDVSDVH